MHPLVTALLCLSQRSFFLTHWPSYLSVCLSAVKGSHHIARVALDSIYRLVWVYMVRIGGEDNTKTETRLRSILETLFPPNQKGLVPRDGAYMTFVRILLFISKVLSFCLHVWFCCCAC